MVTDRTSSLAEGTVPKPRADVLDKGFVSLELAAGNDLMIVNAARMSFSQKSLELTAREEGLLNFLMRERHGTPFEMVEFWWHIKCPIFVAREWMRHRIACLPGDTKITMVQPNGTPYKRTIKHLYDTTAGVFVDEHKVKNGFSKSGKQAYFTKPAHHRHYNYERTLRVFDEERESFTTGKMANIWQSGIKEVFEIKTVDGYSLKGSADHRVLTPEGWVKISELGVNAAILRQGLIKKEANRSIPPALRQGIGVWTSMQRPYIIGQGTECVGCQQYVPEEYLHLDHHVPVTLNLSLALEKNNLVPLCKACHREKTNKEQKFSNRCGSETGARVSRLLSKPVRVGEEMTYDIEMAGPHHNYLANNIIVHNSYNEMSGRYKELPMEFYLPSPENVRTQVGKPGSYSFEAVDAETAAWAINEMQEAYDFCATKYKRLLDKGIAKELSRDVLPVGIYTEFLFKTNFRSLMNFISLRADETALYEIRVYAQAMAKIAANIVPVSWQKFESNNRQTP